jgi:pyrrolidone-carboxylate peptidase
VIGNDHSVTRESTHRLRALVPAAVALSLLITPAVASAQQDTTPPCFDPAAPLSVEEQRLDDVLVAGGPAVGPELVRLAGFTASVQRFTEKLCAAPSARAAKQLVSSTGADLWKTAVKRAQSTQPTWDAYDDRPLYWARLHLTKALRQWTPRSAVSAADRAALVESVDRTSRGVTDVRFPAQPGVRKIVVTGFDPFQLQGTSVRRGNPAGAAALQLDGKVFDTPQGKVVVQAAVLPVLWGGFDEGIVEAVYGTALKAQVKPDAFVTISQGRPGRFDVERWASRWRGGFPDNNDASSRGPVPDAAGWPQPSTEFIETTLPFQKMVDAGTGPFTVQLNRSFCEWPVGSVPGTGAMSCRSDEPTPGAAAASGGGGDYLSNESMYRANRVRTGLGATTVLGGHLHTPVLTQPVDPAALTDAAFEAQRRDIANQAVALVGVV